ncbi:MAG TPA: hypothetical protein VK570_01660, partial [Rubrivivax sp.]|nr:hypothetical protein [Rubrivivax sp.]
MNLPQGAPQADAKARSRPVGAIALPSGFAALRLGVLAVAALILACAGGLSVALSPWNAVALPAGLALASLWRWGRPALAACVLGMAAALLALGLTPGLTMLAAFASAAAALLAQAALRRLRFDARLERAADIAALAGTVVLAAALPAALALGVWVAAYTRLDAFTAGLTGWCVLGLGMLTTAVATLAFGQGTLQALQPGMPRRETFAGMAAIGVMLALLWFAPVAPS